MTMTSDSRVAERNESLWMLVVSPTIWAVHFGLCYITAAVWCAKAAKVLAPLLDLRMAKRTIAPITIALTRINTPAPARIPSLIAVPSGELQIGQAMCSVSSQARSPQARLPQARSPQARKPSIQSRTR